MNTSAKGRRLEHKSRDLLELDGYAVMRSAGSHGAFDLAGFSTAGTVLVQVKANRLPSPAEVAELSAFPVPANCLKQIHRWRDRVAVPDIFELESWSGNA